MHPNSLANLRPISLSHDEAVKNGHDGGVVSGVVRGSMKNFGEYIEIIARQKIKDRRTKKLLASIGITETDDQTHEAVIAARVVSDAEHGNYKAVELFLKKRGQYPKDEMTVTNVNEPVINITFPDDGRGGYE